MNVTKTTIHKLEIERPCGCKVAGDYEDDAYKKPRGAAIFAACEKHSEAAELIEELLREVLEREARQSVAPARLVPRALAAAEGAAPAAPQGDDASQPVARTLRTGGASSNPADRPTQHRPASAPPPRPQGGPQRPVAKAPGLGFRRANTNAGLSAAALSKVASPTSHRSLEIDMEAAPEDPRLTRAVEQFNLLGDDVEDES